MPATAPETPPISKAGLPGDPSIRPRARLSRAAVFDDPRWQLVVRIAESRSLGKSPRLAEFLRYVCDRQIRGRDDEITEQQIGVSVFGRAAGYNSNDDNIVRNYARILRKRLDDYFGKEGRDEPLILSIPRGGYIPVFSPRDRPAAPGREVEAVPEVPERLALAAVPRVEAAPTDPRPHWPFAAAAMILAAVAALCGYLAGQARNPWHPFQSHAARASHQFWSTLFDQHRDTFLVPADGGLVMMQSFTRAKVDLPGYVSDAYRSPDEISRGMQGFVAVTPEDQAKLTHKVAVLASRRYTSVVDLDLSSRLSQLREIVPERLVVRFARDLHIDDLHQGNAILIGSNDANPWVALFEHELNFQFTPGIEYGGSGAIVNTHPLPGESARYASVTGDPSNRTYGVIAYVPNLDHNGHVLIVEGVNMAGTQAAGDFLLQPAAIQPILDRARGRDGMLHPFEVLLATSSLGASASTSEVLSERIHAETP